MSAEFTIADHFEGKDPVVTAIYTRLLDSLRQFGQVSESPKKTSIHLDKASGFAGVNTRKNYLLLNFRTSSKIDSPRIDKIEQHSAKRFMHTVKLQTPDEIDAELLGWLKSAYELAG
ncbi:MAG: DUF5655 domain-containing protein [Chloroflexota bacterium]